ncbi:ubiquinone/menaquinone biosynthesis C-methylase UbiE [Elusimicrobium posterum]|uniref:class I SAM-dependent methyltransferase n=1 Tax=Elusimicrobium posterum TaxID=3116653 RepID=UPI003C750EFA
MSYTKTNKEAWEEAFSRRTPNWGDENYKLLKTERLPFFEADAVKELEQIDFKGKNIAQFCCNNGRELLSLMQLGAARGTGFDIAENIIAQAKDTAVKAEIKNCDFIACDILEIDAKYNNSFDFIMFTIGAITWFKDLDLLFKKVSDCLKPGGILFIHDYHPLTNTLPLPEEEGFDPAVLGKMVYPYFRKEPWVGNNGIEYISGRYESKTFTSFAHNLSSLINTLADNGIRIKKFNEYDYDIGLTNVYDKKDLPLSYIMVAEKIL